MLMGARRHLPWEGGTQSDALAVHADRPRRNGFYLASVDPTQGGAAARAMRIHPAGEERSCIGDVSRQLWGSGTAPLKQFDRNESAHANQEYTVRAHAECTSAKQSQHPNYRKATKREIELGLLESASWHYEFRHSAYVFIGGLDYDLTEVGACLGCC